MRHISFLVGCCAFVLLNGDAIAWGQVAPAEAPAVSLAPVSEDASRAAATFYEVDRGVLLEARVVEKVEKDDLPREKIVFRGAQGFLVPAYLQMPAKPGPHPCVLLLHGWSGSKDHWWQDGNYISGGNVRSALLAAGFAVMALDAQCHGDRIAQNDFAPVNHYVDPATSGAPARRGYFSQAEIYIQTTRDYRRAIDYLETRADIDRNRIGAVGYSMGGQQTFLLTGVEPRIKAAVAVATPADRAAFSPIAPQNFVRGIGQRPFLTIIGRRDELCPLEHAQALQALVPSKTTGQVLFDAGHKLPVDYVPHAVEWIKRYL